MRLPKAYNPQKHEIEATRKREQALEDIEQLLDGLPYWQFRFRHWFTHRFYWIREESMFYLGSACWAARGPCCVASRPSSVGDWWKWARFALRTTSTIA